MKGIDIASMQGTVDFAKVKAAGIEIVYIKATEGLTYNSPTMLAQYKGAKAVGLKVGFYHYLRANNPVSEANNFLAVTAGLGVDCKYAIDVEIPLGQTASQISSNIRQFADHLIANGKGVIVYTGDAFYSAYLNSTVQNIGMWIAHYGVSKPDKIGVGFQYSETGRLNGVNGDVDLDTFTNDIFLKPVATIVVAPQFIISMIANIENVGLKATSGINSCSAGTIGQAKRLEMFSMTISNVDFTYSIHEESVGDEQALPSGSTLGTIGVSKRIEGITINVNKVQAGYKLQYRANIQNLGLTAWVDSGTFCGTKGKSLRLEEIQVQIIKA